MDFGVSSIWSLLSVWGTRKRPRLSDWQEAHEVQHAVVPMAVIHCDTGYGAQSAQGKARGGKAGGNPVRTSRGPVLVESHRTLSGFNNHVDDMFPPEQPPQPSTPGFLSGVSHVGTLCLA